MFKAKYMICLGVEAFPSARQICLGSQMASIINNLSNIMGSHAWFCADVDACSPLPGEIKINSFELKKIGDDSFLLELCDKISQFLSGVFIAISNNKHQHLNLCVGTEDEQFRPLDVNEVLIEIRAFDTSYFEIYSDEYDLIKKLSDIYNVDIEKNRSESSIE